MDSSEEQVLVQGGSEMQWNIYSISLDDMDRALDLLKEFPSINARDAVHAATMLNNGIKKYYLQVRTSTLLRA